MTDIDHPAGTDTIGRHPPGSDQRNPPVDTGVPSPTVASRSKPPRAVLAIVAGLCLAAAVPPWGWWPLAFVGFALTDRLLADRGRRSRFGIMWLVAAAWLYPATLWMWDLAAPGYLVAGGIFALYFAAAAALTPSDGLGRRLVLPGAVAVAELARWHWPFGGVPLANLALTQVNTPIGQLGRIGGPALVVAVVVVIGQAISAGFEAYREPSQRHRAGRWAGSASLVVLALLAAAYLHPRSQPTREITVALVQGGGPQRTRASSFQEPVVLARHIEATRTITEPVDLVVWPENVVNPGSYLSEEEARQRVVELAAELDASVVGGWFKPVSPTATANYQSVINPDGSEPDSYDKQRLVPFGEYVPLRPLAEWLATTTLGSNPLPRRDVRVGTTDSVLDTPVGPVGVSISWEGYFEDRARAAVGDGAQLLTNPTNGSSYWLTMVQTQQLASNQLRAIENDRWVLQVAPTGLTAAIDPNGRIIQRTGISERAVLVQPVTMLEGRTLHSLVGFWPVLAYGLGVTAWGLWRDYRASNRSTGHIT